MPRSEESKARRRAYTREWLKRHPGYRRQRELATGYKRPSRARPEDDAPIPILHTGHCLFDEARRLTGIEMSERSRALCRRDDLMREDGLSEAVLAILENRDPRIAWKQYRSCELAWIYKTTCLPEEHDKEEWD